MAQHRQGQGEQDDGTHMLKAVVLAACAGLASAAVAQERAFGERAFEAYAPLASTASIQAPQGKGRVAVAPSPELASLIALYAQRNGLPIELAHRVIQRESMYNPRARNRSYWGLMQLRHETARGMGYRGSPQGLLDAQTNLRYGMAYLRNAYLVAGGDQRRAVQLYARGYYYEAKRRGLLGKIRRADDLPQYAGR
jgi:soluble lytic murein transglycosylase-like protein